MGLGGVLSEDSSLTRAKWLQSFFSFFEHDLSQFIKDVILEYFGNKPWEGSGVSSLTRGKEEEEEVKEEDDNDDNNDEEKECGRGRECPL